MPAAAQHAIRKESWVLNTQDPRYTPSPQEYPPYGGQQQYNPQYNAPQQYGPPHGQQYGGAQQQYSPHYGAPQQQYASPYAPAAQYAPQPQQYAPRRAVKNPLATRALIYGIISFVLFVAIFFTSYIVLATFGLYAIYYAIKGLIYANKLPGHKGMIPAIFGLLLSVLSVLGTLGVIALNAMLK